MSDQWEFYPCIVGGEQAFIFVDIGIQNIINTQAPSLLVIVTLVYKEPSLNGLPKSTEFDLVSSIEKNIEHFSGKNSDFYVGRITLSGHRYFYIYTTKKELLWKEFIDSLKAQSGYDLNVSSREDKDYRGYWDELYPTPDDWQMIKDIKVIEILEKNGDSGSIPRKVDHWIYFFSQSASEAFKAWLANSRFTYEQSLSFITDDKRFCIRASHYGSVLIHDISSYSLELRRVAAELDGVYDGWETEIISPKN
jgi:uncharacterized protein (TIGR01619 family)